jgi:hypothetical protein
MSRLSARIRSDHLAPVEQLESKRPAREGTRRDGPAPGGHHEERVRKGVLSTEGILSLRRIISSDVRGLLPSRPPRFCVMAHPLAPARAVMSCAGSFCFSRHHRHGKGLVLQYSAGAWRPQGCAVQLLVRAASRLQQHACVPVAQGGNHPAGRGDRPCAHGLHRARGQVAPAVAQRGDPGRGAVAGSEQSFVSASKGGFPTGNGSCMSIFKRLGISRSAAI